MESQVKLGGFGWILVLHGEQSIPQITNTGTMQVSAKTAPVVNNQNTERPKASLEKKEANDKTQDPVSKKLPVSLETQNWERKQCHQILI
tara:strand:+ start:53 stop:322 length:270 start_codon:yes stop_codon:yes gene_type:complete